MIDKAIFEGRVDTLLVLAMIILIEVVKRVFGQTKVQVPVWIWKLAVIVLGMVAALLAADWGTLKVREVVVSMIMYAGCASLVYQTIKIPVKRIQDRRNGNHS